jgi:hypothetical protein
MTSVVNVAKERHRNAGQGADEVENNPPRDIKPTSTEIDEQVQTAVREVLALRELTRTTQMQTSRSQGYILKQLSPPVLARVAVILAEFEKGGAQ